MCHDAVPAAGIASTASSGSNEASKDGSSGPVEQVAGPNISDELFQIAGEAAECGQRLNHLQDWVNGQLAVSTAQ